jgi:hypothetical protein
MWREIEYGDRNREGASGSGRLGTNKKYDIGIGIANLTEGFVVPGIIISQIHPCFDLGIVSDFAVKTSGLNLLLSEHSPHGLISLHLTHLRYITSILWHD